MNEVRGDLWVEQEYLINIPLMVGVKGKELGGYLKCQIIRLLCYT